MIPVDDDARFPEIENAILKERGRALAHIRSTRLENRLRARLEAPPDTGTRGPAWYKIALASLGAALVMTGAILIWISIRQSKPGSVPAYDAITTTLSLIFEPSRPELSAKFEVERIQEEKSENLISHVFSQILQGQGPRISYKSTRPAFDGIPLFTSEEINRILIRDRVIEKALMLVKGENKEV